MIFLLIIEFLVLIVLLLFSAFFSSAETAFFSLNPIHIHRIRKNRPDRAGLIAGIIANPESLLSTILIGNIMVNVAASMVGLAIVSQLLPRYAEIVSVFAMTLLLLIFGEITPKRIAVVKPEILSVYYAPYLARLIKILTPLGKLLQLSAGFFKKALVPYGRILNEDELRTLITISSENGVLSEDEREMVDGIIRLENIRASDVMTPRVDITGLDMDDDPATFEPIIKKTVFRYLVVYREHLDNIEGILDVRRYLLDKKRDFKSAVVQARFVPESARLNTILEDFQKQKLGIAFVVDEYGGLAGLLTIGDVLEEVIDVGDDDETDKSEFEQTGDKKWLIDGSVSLEEINNELDIELEAEDSDRIAGWVMEQTGRIPQTGEIVRFKNILVTVQEIRKKRITRVAVELVNEEDLT